MVIVNNTYMNVLGAYILLNWHFGILRIHLQKWDCGVKRQTDSNQRGWVRGCKKVKALSRQHVCTAHRPRQQSTNGLRERGARAGWRCQKGESKDNSNNINYKK